MEQHDAKTHGSSRYLGPIFQNKSLLVTICIVAPQCIIKAPKSVILRTRKYVIESLRGLWGIRELAVYNTRSMGTSAKFFRELGIKV